MTNEQITTWLATYKLLEASGQVDEKMLDSWNDIRTRAATHEAEIYHRFVSNRKFSSVDYFRAAYARRYCNDE